MSHKELKKILYVEDDSSIQMVALLALQEVGGFEAIVCSSGKEALAAAPGYKPDLLLLDVMMPGIDGPTTLTELRKLEVTQKTPAIFMTAKVQTHELNALNKLSNVIAVISKPFDPMTLASQIRAAWDASR